MHNLRKVWNLLADKLLAGFGALYVLLPMSPLFLALSYRDAGVFQYIGWRILNGEIPYRDIWDHKPPLIYYLNALGLAITDGSLWGVWLVQFVAISLAVWIGYKLIQKTQGTLPAVFGTALWLFTLVFVIEGGNLTEEYALPFQFACFWLVHDFNGKHMPKKRLFLIGVLCGISFMLKQTTIGIGIAIVLYLLIRRISSKQITRIFFELFTIAAGFLTIFTLVVIYFGAHGALAQFWDQVFRYNFIYSTSITGFLNRLTPVFWGISLLSSAGLFPIAMLGYLVTLLTLTLKKRDTDRWTPLLIIALIDLPIELLFICASGKIFAHYYMSLFPVLSIFAGVFAGACTPWISALKVSKTMKGLIIIYIILIFFFSSFVGYKKQLDAYRNNRDETIIHYIENTTTTDETVLLWGAESTINFSTRRKSPTRYVYQYPLYEQSYVDEQMIEELLENILQNRPRLIINTYDSQTHIFEFPVHSEEISVKIDAVKAIYNQDEMIGYWTVYKYSEPQ